MPKILITGVSGMLGRDMADIFLRDKKYQVFGIARHEPENLYGLNFVKLDLLNLSKLKKLLKTISPDVIIHCAAITNIEVCEKNKLEAKTIHVEVSRILAKNSNIKTKLIYISTDSVFDGTIGNYKEFNKTAPLNYYAKTKQQGEQVILKWHNRSLVIRTNIFGFHSTPGGSRAEWGISNLSNKQSFSGFIDSWFNPVYTKQLAVAIKSILDKKNFIKGILNIGSNEFISKYDFFVKLAEVFKQDKKLIKQASIEDDRSLVIRSKNTTLNTDKFQKIFKHKISFFKGMKEFKKDFLIFNKLKNEEHHY